MNVADARPEVASAQMRAQAWWQANAAAGLHHPRYVAHQQRVPRLPVPALADTCRKYLRAALPLQRSARAREATRAAVAAFESGEGRALQSELLARDAALPAASSYIESRWYDIAYLGPRAPVPVNSNPAVVLRSVPWAAEDPLWRASTLLSAVGRWSALLRHGELDLELGRDGSARCMNSLAHVLGTARLPRAGGPDQFSTALAPRHVVVLRRGAFYAVDVLTEADEPVPPTTLRAVLHAICEEDGGGAPTRGASASAGAAVAAPPHRCVGNLTALERDEWAAARAALVEAGGPNPGSLACIDEALLVLCLDPSAPPALDVALSETLLAPPRAGGEADRWYDKLQLILYANGEAGLCFEHAPYDGVQLLRMLEDVDKLAAAHGAPSAEPGAAPSRAPSALALTVPPSLEPTVRAAGAHARGMRAELAQQMRRFDGWTSARTRAHGLGLDAVVQMSFQLADALEHGRADGADGGADGADRLPAASVYEACSTQAFRHGRTETIRAVSDESRAFVALALRTRGASPALLPALAAACRAHAETVRFCQAGLGHERHLQALLGLAQERAEGGLPALYTDPAWARACASVLSTSCLRSPALSAFGFGPVVPNGYGLGYVYDARGFTLNITALAGGAVRAREGEAGSGVPDVARFGDAVAEALAMIGAVLDAAPTPTSGGGPAPRSRL